VPIIIAVLSLEGVNASLSLEREHSVTRTHVVNLSVGQIHENLARPIHLDAERSAFLSLFPLPTHIEAGSLKTDDIHKAHFKYKRWGLDGINVKTGETWVKLAAIDLDPAWYFGPMQKAAIKESGDYLIKHVIARPPS